VVNVRQFHQACQGGFGRIGGLDKRPDRVQVAESHHNRAKSAVCASPRLMSGVVWTRFWGREGGTVTGSTSGAGVQLALTRCTWRVRPGPPRTGLGALAALRFSGEEEGHGRDRTLSLGKFRALGDPQERTCRKHQRPCRPASSRSRTASTRSSRRRPGQAGQALLVFSPQGKYDHGEPAGRGDLAGTRYVGPRLLRVRGPA
jgi:hypothetical protein